MIVAGNTWDGFSSSDKQLSLQLARHVPVIYIEPPTSRWSRPGFVRDVPIPNVLRVRSSVPRGLYRSGLHHLLPRVVAGAVRSTLNQLGTDASALIVACPSPVLSILDARCRVVYATDDWVAGAELMGLPRERMRIVQREQAASADVVLAVSSVLAEQYRALGHPNVIVLPNGCDIETLAHVDEVPFASDVALVAPVAGMLGHISDRISLSHLEEVARRDVSLLLVGPRQHGYGGRRFEALVNRPNVCWVGERSYADIPSYLRHMDVGLTPYLASPFNLASSPLKTLEYLAAGRGSVSTELPGVRALDTRQVTMAGSVAAFADAVEHALRIPRTPELMATRRRAVAGHSWALRAETVLAALSGADAGASPPRRRPLAAR